MMRGLFFDNNLRYRTDYLVPEPGENEALIRVTCAGICNTDLEIVKGYMNFRGVPGHEFVGVVERCGNKVLEGKRVVGEINLSCGNCPYCKSGLRNGIRGTPYLILSSISPPFFAEIPFHNAPCSPLILRGETTACPLTSISQR
jgi:threonine dehydrogenase-like Zn-dependent dehydrogenase